MSGDPIRVRVGGTVGVKVNVTVCVKVNVGVKVGVTVGVTVNVTVGLGFWCGVGDRVLQRIEPMFGLVHLTTWWRSENCVVQWYHAAVYDDARVAQWYGGNGPMVR